MAATEPMLGRACLPFLWQETVAVVAAGAVAVEDACTAGCLGPPKEVDEDD